MYPAELMQHAPYQQLVDAVVADIYKEKPELYDRFGDKGVERCREDNYFHLQYLTTSYHLKSTSIFLDYTAWLNEVLTSRGIDSGHIVQNYRLLIEHIPKTITDFNEQHFFITCLKKAIAQLDPGGDFYSQ
ncbi:hypothetical protein [Alkalibacillus almallahensis]|uniref:hypothetical protein n=1 Tax=Alkalibacillus almallahensis TaxID=1379154 RepID=UPI001420171D|nr:hypothetical protein [Alkalibacillus almallahensis]NIK12011.1 hypothetical protein [Alkalibacillus almallahensis]